MIVTVWDIKCKGQIFLSFWTNFCPFPLPNNPKNQNFEKMKQAPADIIIVHKCTKNHVHKLCCSWDKAHDRCNCYFFILGYILPFKPPNSLKNENFKKNEKKGLEISSFYISVQKSW